MPADFPGEASPPSDPTNGLSSAEATRRLEQYGPNEPAPRVHRTGIAVFLAHFGNPLVLILLVASIVSAFAGEVTNAAIISVIVLMSVMLDYFQERRSNVAAQRLREQVALRATVIRDGAPRAISAREIVPGDLLQLSVGDLIPADALVIHAKDFFVDQASLTGESFPVEKSASSTEESAKKIYLGTSVTSGEALAVVEATGTKTEFGAIAHGLSTKPGETAFERGARTFGTFIMKVVGGLVIFVFFVNIAFRRDPMESFLFAVALAVGLTPGLLPMIVSVTLAHGALRLARKRVIVKRMAAIENLGGMDILCTDKTGTLTEGAITLERHVDIEGNQDDQVLKFTLLNAALQTGLRSPLDEAILRRRDALPACTKLDEIPFDFARRRLSVVASLEGRTLMVTKGAPESVLPVCSGYEIRGSRMDLDQTARDRFAATFRGLSEAGYRVLGIAYRDVPVPPGARFGRDDERDLTFLGFAAFLDPPKRSAVATLKALRKDSIEVKVLTGDNELVTSKICEEVGLEVRGIVTGEQLAGISMEALVPIATRTTIFARVSPDQKRSIIVALQRAGHSVGYLGDGINDAPSLRVADAGITVDSAVDVARETADLILLRKSLRVIHDGILEGRRTFGNIMKYILMGTSSNFGNMFSMAGASLFLGFLPMLPPQILLNNLLYDFSQVTIPGDRVDADYLLKPRTWSVELIRRYMIWMGLVSSAFDYLTFAILIWLFHAGPELFRTGWFIESLATQTLVILVIRTRGAPWRSRPSRGLTLSTSISVAIGVLLPFTPLSAPLGFVHPPIGLLAWIAAMVVAYLAAAEVAKRQLYRRYLP